MDQTLELIGRFQRGPVLISQLPLNSLFEMDVDETELALMDLKDDCFRAIFSHLKNADLVAVSQCCRRLNAVATETMRSRIRKMTVGLSSKGYNGPTPFLIKYGEEIRNVRVYKTSIEYLLDINQFCPNLSILEWVRLPVELFTEQFPAELFTKLTELDINFVEGDFDEDDDEGIGQNDSRIQQIMRQCKKLTRLSIAGERVKPFLAVECPSLVNFRVTYAKDFDYNDEFRDFCTQNPNLKSIEFDNIGEECGFVPDFTELKNLTELAVYKDESFFAQDICEMIERLDVVPTLRSLTVEIRGKDGITPSFPKFGHLKQLEYLNIKLFYNGNRFELSHAGTLGIFDLPNLRKLDFDHFNESDVRLRDLISFVQSHPLLETLKIRGFRRAIVEDDDDDDDDEETKQKKEREEEEHNKFENACKMAQIRLNKWRYYEQRKYLPWNHRDYYDWWSLRGIELTNLIRDYLL